MEVDSEDDLFDEADEFDDDDAWGIIWDAGIEDEDFDGDMHDNGDVEDSSIDGSEDLSAGVMEEFLREKSAKSHDDHNVVVAILQEDELSHNDHGNPDYMPLDLPKSGISMLPSSKTHHQTCDSCCFGPRNGDGEFVTVVNESGHEISRVHMVNMAGLQGRGRQGPGIPSKDKVLLLPHLRILGRPARVNACYSCAWSDDGSYMGITTAASRMSFWLQSEGNSCSQDPTAADIADDGVPGPSLQPCGSILIPEIDHNWQNRTVHDVLTRCRLMLNCVRFGNIAGQQRAIVAGQNGAVYVFEVPAPPSPGQAPPPGDKFICHTLRPAAAKGRYGVHTELITDLLNSESNTAPEEPLRMPVLLENTLLNLMPDLREPHHAPLVLGQPIVNDCLRDTQILARFHGAINCASPSPCGRWVAVLTDSMTVTLLPEALDYKLRCSMLLTWPDVGPPSSRSTCIGCQYVAWSPEGQYVAVSSDSHKAVSVWRIRLKSATALDPAELGLHLQQAIVKATSPRHHSAKDMVLHANDLANYLPEAHQRFVSQLPGARNSHRPAKSGSRGNQDGVTASSRRQSEPESVAGSGGTSRSTTCARHVRERVLRVLGAALWDQVCVEHVCAYSAHMDPCFALTFVPGSPSMLCWAEERGRVHLCDVRRPYARQCVHLSTLPMQMAFAIDGVSCTPASEVDNWGIRAARLEAGPSEGDVEAAVQDEEDDASLQLEPPPDVDAPQANVAVGCHVTHASSILDVVWDIWQEAGHTAMPVALVLALARGERLKVPKVLAEAGREIQKRYKNIRDAGLSPSSESTVMDKLMERVGRGPFLHQNIITGITAAGQNTVVVSTVSHIFRLQVSTRWDYGVAWPQKFKVAVQELLKVHRRQTPHSRAEGAGVCLGDMPPDVMNLIIQKAAGERVDWIDQNDTGALERDAPSFCGLTREQCFSDFFLNAVHVPPKLVSGLLCP